MAQKTAQSSITKKRQPAKKRLPSSRTKSGSRDRKTSVILPITRTTNLTVTLKLSKSRARRNKTTHKRKNKPLYKQTITFLRFRRQLELTLLIITLCSVSTGYFGLQLLTLSQVKTVVSPSQVTQHKPTKPTVNKHLSRSAAVSVQIPSIALDTLVETIGTNADGTLEVPTNYLIAGWYHLGPAPGEVGPAVISGHVDSAKGPGVFYRLREVQPEQLITVQRADGKTATFKVTRVQNFLQDEFPTNEVYGNIDHAGLRLITCGGSFNPLQQRYTHNTVVFASLL